VKREPSLLGHWDLSLIKVNRSETGLSDSEEKALSLSLAPNDMENQKKKMEITEVQIHLHVF